MRPLDRLVILALFGLLAVMLAGRWPGTGDPPPVRRPPIVAPPVPSLPPAGPLLPPAGRGDPGFIIDLPSRVEDAVGTAFAIDPSGLYLTARHVIEGCAQVYLRRREGWMPVEVSWKHPRADMAALRTRLPGDVLPMSGEPLRVGQAGFGVGFPRGQPGAVAGALLGRSIMRVEGRFAGTASVTTWAEMLRDPPNAEDTLGGISGGPLVDEAGRAIGIVVAATQRRGRFHAVAPELLADAGYAPLPGAPRGPAFDWRNYAQAGAQLRARNTVMQAGCRARTG